ncbi:hypothetical protein RintRC_0446 [Richelia intracellularis]|nr:hypothetical protein RintRC_0446 [Richelia intracellularis]
MTLSNSMLTVYDKETRGSFYKYQLPTIKIPHSPFPIP